MYGRIQNANGQNGGDHGMTGGAGGAKSGLSIAGSALRKAGLMDGDVGMRSANSAGPNRRGGGGGSKRGRGASSSGASAGPSRIQVDDEGSTQGKARKARDRANPLAGRPKNKKGNSGTADPAVRGQAFGIRGAAKGKQKGGPPNAATAVAESTPASFNSSGTVGVLRRFLANRWNGAANLLDLSNMKDDGILKEGGVHPPGDPNAHKDIAAVIFKLASEMYQHTASITLGNNDFKTLAPLATLAQYFPNLQNLSLEHNDIKWTKDLGTLNNKQGKFTSLRELVLTGNPMQTNAASALNEEGYRAEVIAKFPTLTLLDSVPVSPKESEIAQLPTGKGKADQILGPEVPIRDFPIQTRVGFSDESANGIVPGFLHRFFSLFDTSRESAELRAVYASNATWTFATQSTTPPRARSAGYQSSKDLPRQKDLHWNAYKGVSNHNLMSLGNKPGSKGCPVGGPTILTTFKRLPVTRHPLTDASKFVVDSWILPNAAVGAAVGSKQGTQAEQYETPDAVLFINVKGEFAEGPSFGVRSFERTFIVAPAAPNSSAAQAGWACTILSEQWTVKSYAGVDGWKPDTLPVGGVPQQTQQPMPTQMQQPPQQPAQAPQPAQPEPAPGINEQQHSLALQFSAETRLTYPFAVQCLAENNWDGNAAMAVFTNLNNAGSIPTDAFIAS